MKEFDRFVEEGEVREVSPDRGQGRSLVRKAGKRLEYANEPDITEENADLILEDCYEAVREALDAFLARDGFKSYSHEATIVYGFEKLDLDHEAASRLNKLRKLRNDSKYRGEDVKIKEARKASKLAEELVPELRSRYEE